MDCKYSWFITCDLLMYYFVSAVQNAENGFERAKHWRSEIGKPLTNRLVR